MDHLANHRAVLELAASGKLPKSIDDTSTVVSIHAVRDLVEAGYLSAIDASTMGGPEYLEPRITVAGREYLNELLRRAADASPAGRARRLGSRLLDGGIGVAVGLAIAWGSKYL